MKATTRRVNLHHQGKASLAPLNNKAIQNALHDTYKGIEKIYKWNKDAYL